MSNELSDLKIKLKNALKRISDLEAENSRLKSIAAKTRETVKSYDLVAFSKPRNSHEHQSAPGSSSLAPIDKNSSPENKVNLFRSLFRGRENVFACRWIGKNGKSGYSPSCVNDWKQGVCGKYSKIPCANCVNRKLIPLTENQIYRHLSGEIVIGIYPLLDDDSCWFLAIDFDKKGWQEDVIAFVDTCQRFNIPAYVEKSRSGNGAHVWFFFTENIPAYLARKLGTALLTKAMTDRHQISFDSYDRLFPNQDKLPKGGFGNLIALPLQRKARESGNSEFVDSKLEIIADQWEYLARVEKINKCKVNNLLSENLSGKSADVISQSFENGYNDILPWESTSAQPEEYHDLPNQIIVILSNMIYIEKTGLSQKLMNRFIWLGAFHNPEYYKAQAIRLPVFNIPRIINLSAETEKFIAIPRGCMDNLSKLFDDLKVKMVVQDMRKVGIKINVSFLGELNPEQTIAGKTMLGYDTGVLSATTAFGKTIVAIWMIAQRQINTLIIVHRRQLMEQWLERLKCFLKNSEVGQIGAGQNNRTGKVDVAIIQSLNHKQKVKELVKEYGMVIVDECHHISAFSFEQVLKTVQAKYVYGLSATPERKDGHHPIIYMQCGEIRHKTGAKSLLQRRAFCRRVITRYTNFKMPDGHNQEEIMITNIYKALVEDEKRNNMILDDIISAISSGKSPLILTERKAHVEFFANKLAGFSKNVIVLQGGMGRKQVKAAREKLKSIPETDERIIISTGKYIGEGFDDSRLDTLFLTMPISWKGVLQQYAGRLHRNHYNKTEVVIYDYVDRENFILAKMFRKRVKGYEGMGYEIKDD
jgi:superfamily II DNA or RNA helicase